MEIKIGVKNAPRELSIDTALEPAEIEKLVSESAGGVLRFEDSRGRLLIIPADSLAYVEIAAATTGTVGFRTGQS